MAAPMQMAMNMAGKAADHAMGKADDLMKKMFNPDRVELNLQGFLMKASDRYILNPFGKQSPGCCDLFCLALGCTSKNLLYFTMEGKHMNVHNPGNCCCRKPWQVSTWEPGQTHKDQVIHAKVLVDKAKPCTSANGYAFSICGAICCLPMCQCDGHLKHMWVTDESKPNAQGMGQERYTVLQELVFCWVIGFTCAGACVPCGMTIASMKACCELCSGRILREVIQPIYGQQETRSSKPTQVGQVGMMHLMCPVSICCAMPCQTIKYRFLTVDKKPMDVGEMASAALLLSMYRGMGGLADMCLPNRPMFPQPQGVSCADMGLHASVKYMDVQDALKDGVFDM